MYIATIDTGTTNTRVSIWQGKGVIARVVKEVGVRDTAITGSKQILENGVKAALNAVVMEAGIKQEDLSLILASGMITSNVGLYELPHLFAPAGVEELARGMVRVQLDKVSSQPIWFIPGIKNNVSEITLENFEKMDFMRGEETETVGIIDLFNLTGSALIVLPGSHTKFIHLNQNAQVTGCITSLAGELLSLITKNTIIGSSLNHSFSQEMKEMMILKGAEYAQRLGLNRSCFLIRVIDQFLDCSIDDKANFLEGIVFGTDLVAVKNSQALNITPEITVVIGGSKPLRSCFETLIKNDSYFKGSIYSLDDSAVMDLAGYGAIRIAQKRGLIQME